MRETILLLFSTAAIVRLNENIHAGLCSSSNLMRSELAGAWWNDLAPIKPHTTGLHQSDLTLYFILIVN